jgi:copper chaperone CopZ
MVTPTTRTTVLLIAGMRANRCRERIIAALEGVPGVQRVDINLYRAQATITHDRACGVAELFRATLNMGYNAALADEGRADRAARSHGGRGAAISGSSA